MATKIRLARAGSKKRPFYRIVVADVRAPRDGKFIEKVGTYNPLLPKTDPNRVTFKTDRVKFWLGTGAAPTDRVESFLVAAKLFERSKRKQAHLAENTKRTQAEKAAKLKAEADAKKAAEAEAAAAAGEAAQA